jgi:hypothetical protein
VHAFLWKELESIGNEKLCLGAGAAGVTWDKAKVMVEGPQLGNARLVNLIMARLGFIEYGDIRLLDLLDVFSDGGRGIDGVVERLANSVVAQSEIFDARGALSGRCQRAVCRPSSCCGRRRSMREKVGVRHMIDWPSGFDPKEVWRDFLREMQTLPQDASEVQEAIKQAEQVLAGPDFHPRDRQLPADEPSP